VQRESFALKYPTSRPNVSPLRQAEKFLLFMQKLRETMSVSRNYWLHTENGHVSNVMASDGSRSGLQRDCLRLRSAARRPRHVGYRR
jgi:hypothetical protein